MRIQFSSVQSFSHAQLLWTHEPQHARPSCLSPTPRVHPNPCPSSQWCQPTISSSVIPFSSCPQSFPVSGSFPMSQLFAWGGQSVGVSASASVLPMNTHDWSPLGWTCWISLQSKGLSRVPNFPQFIVIHTVEDFGIVNKAEIDVFLGLSCFFYDPADVGNLISGSSAFSKSSLNIWKFTVPVLLKPGLENFKHYFTSVWDECNCEAVWAFFGIAFLWDWNENWPFPVLWPLLSFPYLLAYWVQHFHTIIFQDLK